MVKFVAEISSNHNADLSRCEQFIKTAAEIGCWGVKFQLFKIDKLFAPKVLALSQKHRDRRQWELPVSFISKLAEMCHRYGILFGCTPFYLEAVDELAPYVDFFKIASYELIWTDLLKKVATQGKTTVLSTGMATLDEVEVAANVLKNAGLYPAILHCVSSYPCPVEEANLAAISTISQKTGCPVGWSDHTVSPAVIYRAIHRYDAGMIEFHLDLQGGTGFENNMGHCWGPGEIKEVIQTVKAGFLADGNGFKSPVPSELPDRDWRRDPVDGLRPMRKIRDAWNG